MIIDVVADGLGGGIRTRIINSHKMIGILAQLLKEVEGCEALHEHEHWAIIVKPWDPKKKEDPLVGWEEESFNE